MTEEFKNYDNYYNGFLKECRKHIIKELEQPNMDKAMIRILTKENDDLKVEIGRLRQALNNPTDDCVSREQALSAIHNLYPSTPSVRMNLKKWQKENKKYFECENIIKALPRVSPTHKVGKWIKSGGSFRCSECIAMPEFRDIRRLKYCPNCGADMRGSEE